MKIYNSDGYPNWPYLWDSATTFVNIVGGRGTGKSYGALREVIYRQNAGMIGKFMYVRRLGNQIKKAKRPAGNPFKKLNLDYFWSIYGFAADEDLIEFYPCSPDENGKMKPSGPCIGYGASISQTANISSLDFSDVDVIIFDEFVAKANEKPLRDEAETFLGFYETINRNREFEGRAPVKCIMLGNAHQLANPYYIEWGFMSQALRMIRGKQMMWKTADGTRAMILLLDSPISAKKRQTALYQNVSDGFISMAIDNSFMSDPTSVNSRPLREYNYVCTVGELGIYIHKRDGTYYINGVTRKERAYAGRGFELEQWRVHYGLFKTLYYADALTFDTYDHEMIFRSYLKMI